MGVSETPVLEGDAARAVAHRGSHMQIIAAAGSGKTEVVSQRVASLLADGAAAKSIVAFTFTEKAARELRERITTRVEERLGRTALDGLGGLFVGTIHAYCFRLLQTHVPRFETYDVLDENQLNAFLAREGGRLGVKELDPEGRNRLYRSIQTFLKGIDVVENEMLDLGSLPDPFRSVATAYFDALERYRLLTFGQIVAKAVEVLDEATVVDSLMADLRYVIVDEYQDVNPVQEALLARLAKAGVELCVVGDDDQAIYQWRGSTITNITTFVHRYPDVAIFSITDNRRSVPAIIEAANTLAASIPGRIPKQMGSIRSGHPGDTVAVWSVETEFDEAGQITLALLDLHDAGVAYSDMAVLVRAHSAYAKLREDFATFDIPVQPGGRTGLFDQPEALALGRAVVWLVGYEWRFGHGPAQPIDHAALVDELMKVFAVGPRRQRLVRATLELWRTKVEGDTPASLVGDLYELLEVLGAPEWDMSHPLVINRLGTVARFTALLADYEAVARRARSDPDAPGEQVGGQNRGGWFYRGLAAYVLNYATGAYDGFDGEDTVALDAVTLSTVHGSKGLEWPVVFVPSLTANRFPTVMAGRPQAWPIPRDLFDAARYEGGDDEERRLFYVAMTRARDLLSLSRHDTPGKRRVAPSPYWTQIADHVGTIDIDDFSPPPVASRSSAEGSVVELTYSDLASFLDCAMAYRLRSLLGFRPRMAPELGYGKAVHHVMRSIAEHTRTHGRVPSVEERSAILDDSFFLPAANRPAHRNLKLAASRLVDTYVRAHPDDLRRVWETERPFELHLDGVRLSGRADVILDHEGGVPKSLAILDYKTSTHGDDHGLQLQVYADAGRREGLEVRGAYVHDLKRDARTAVDVSPDAINAAEETVLVVAARVRSADFTASPGARCRRCEVRTVCGSAQR